MLMFLYICILNVCANIWGINAHISHLAVIMVAKSMVVKRDV